MQTIFKWVLVSTSITLAFSSLAQTGPVNEQAHYASLRAQMQRACPAVWEDLGANMDTSSLNAVIWAEGAAAQADKAEFVALLQEIMSDSPAEEIEAMADDVATVATECASHRVALLDALISKTPRDVLLAMDAVNRGLNKSIEYLDGGWSTGDVRVTGRLAPQDGWVFLVGQTIGGADSTADLVGDKYNELFELAKNWAPNAGTEDWAAGHLVTLPDMRGRALFAADNMGGQSANNVTKNEADKIGGAFGDDTLVLTSSQLPTHKHTMNAAGGHGHSMGYSGDHKHSSKQALYGAGNYGWGTFSDKWPTGGIRPTTDGGNSATLTNAIFPAGNHSHSLSSAGNHTHTMNNTGSSAVVDKLPPAIVFNIEMKY